MRKQLPFRRRPRWDRAQAYGADRRRRWGRAPTSAGGGAPGRGWSRFAPLWLGAIGAGLLFGSGAISGKIEVPGPGRFGECHSGGGRNCVVDGDTIYLERVKIRILGLDTPETHDFRCIEEKALGDRATGRLRQLLNSGLVTVEAAGRDEDRYGRKLRIVRVGGTDVAQVLIGEGLARPYGGGPKSDWCAG